MFTKLNLNFGFLSLNVRGIRSFDKWKVQETYTTPKMENVWKSQWRGELFLASAQNTAEMPVIHSESQTPRGDSFYTCI